MVKSVHQWAKIQLSEINSTQKVPLCWALGDGLLIIGTHRVEKINARVWRVYNNNHEFVHDFVSRPSAVFYCVCLQTNQIPLAHKLLKYDNQLGLLEADCLLLKTRLKQTQQKTTGFQTQLYAAKLTQNLALQSTARSLLEKTLRSAKYLKLWENMP